MSEQELRARIVQAETDRQRELTIWFDRVTALRQALRDVCDLADASVPESVQSNRIASDALDVDGVYDDAADDGDEASA